MVETFKPVQISEYFLRQIAAGLKKEIYDSMFKQIFEVLNSNSVYNDKKTLTNAIQSGRIYYENGAFRSNKPFSNAVADKLEKLGAKFKYGAYYIDRALLPVEIENALAIVAARETAKISALNGLLARLAATVGQDTAVKLFIEKAVERMFKKLQVDLKESTKELKVPVIDVSVDIPEIDIADTDLQKIDEYHQLTKEERKNFEVPKLNLDEVVIDKRAKKIAEDYTYNMDYWVKNWKAKEIAVMRRDVLDMVQKGKPLSDSAISALRKKKLIEGRKPKFYIAKTLAQRTDRKVEYSRHKGLESKSCESLLIDSLKDHGELTRQEIDRLLWPVLSDQLDDTQKKNKIGNLLAKLRRKGVLSNITTGNNSVWSIRQ